MYFASAVSALDDSLSIIIPPGGYAWSIFTDSSGLGDFETVTVISPGPVMESSELLPDSAAAAIDLCTGWLRGSLWARFTDLLYEDIDDEFPVLPVFADVNADGLDDLILSREEGTPGRRIFLAPDWTEISDAGSLFESRQYCDVNNDGHPDSVHMSEEGVLTLFSCDSIQLITEGFDVSGIAGSALGDMEGDGLADLILGTDSGNLLVYRNRGTIDVPCFIPFISESFVRFPMNAGAFSSPAVYLSGDSLLNVAAGTQQNGLKFYTADTGEGTMSLDWTEIAFTGYRDPLLNLSPVEFDLHGEVILICGTRSGILFETRPGSDSLHLLNLPPVPGTYANLAVAPVNGDESPDLIAGTMEGAVFYLPGCEGWFEGSWIRIDSLPSIPSGAPAAWKNGLVFGSADGAIRYFAQAGHGAWIDSTESSEFRNIDAGEYSTPDFADLDNDGVAELIIGNSRGSLICFELDDLTALRDPLFIERFSWEFEPNSAVSDIQSYYSRYFIPYSVLRTPSGISTVLAYSREILRAQPEHRDEIAYCIANTPVEILRQMHENDDTDLFSVNAREIYEMAEKLEYVQLTDSGSTTECQLKTEEGWIGISLEDYYRFVVHPRILFEVPARINADYWYTPHDTAAVPLDQWLNHEPDSIYGASADHVFWRRFIPSDSSGGRSLEERMMDAATYGEAVVRLCNFQSHSQPGGLMSFGYLTNDLQPMVIYGKAYGSCGEQSILQTALCRTFFIPAYVVGCRGEDHQWNHYLDPGSGKWNHWDINYGISGIGNVWISGEGVNHTGKTISTISAFGPGNEVWSVTGNVLNPPGSGYMSGDSGYTSTARVDILVTDPLGTAVEGAMVLARSHWNNANSVSEFTYTDESGLCSFQLGWEPNGGYTIDIVSPFGSAGSSNISFSEGDSCFIRYTVPGIIPERQTVSLPEFYSAMSMPLTSRFYPPPYFSRSLYSIDDDDESRSYRSPGYVHWRSTDSAGTLIYMNSVNFRDYRNGLNCRAVRYPFTPEPGDTCYAVLDNKNSFFTWNEFRFSPSSVDSESGESSIDVFAWLSEASPSRNPSVASAIGSSTPEHTSAQSWITYYPDIELHQDDPDDPLSAGFILGPFMVPAGERSLDIRTETDQPGLDIDLFLFADRNSNRSVDDMTELLTSSTTPTSNETISLLDPDTAIAYWIYMHGWQVPDAGGLLDLGLSFKPELLPVHSLQPTGHQSSLPSSYSFALTSEILETGDIYILSEDRVIHPERVDDQWLFEKTVTSTPLENTSLSFFRSDGELIESLVWSVLLDSIPPELSDLAYTVDLAEMHVLLEVICIDDRSGVFEVSAYIDSLNTTQFSRAGDDSLWNCSIDTAPFSGETISINIIAADSAGNQKTESISISVPTRPEVLFSSVYPTGTVYNHRPILQVYADFRDDPASWSASAVLTDSTGSFHEELSPFVIDGNIIQFRPAELLSDGLYSVIVRTASQENMSVCEYSWSFHIDTMME